MTGLYASGATCSSKGTAVYTSSYDAWGNVTSRFYAGTTATLSYDALDHFTQWNAGSTNQEWYVYDSAGNRVLKRTTSLSGTSLTTFPFVCRVAHSARLCHKKKQYLVKNVINLFVHIKLVDNNMGESYMSTYLEWDKDQRAEASSVEELDRLLDQLTLQATNERPFSVDLVADAVPALSIVVGDVITPVNFYSPTSHPLVVGCLGRWEEDGDQVFVFDARGSYSEIEKRYTIPIADAREAMRRFLATGQRPDNIVWY
ncbi:MAG TPA: Imm1 family immunity protein [Ktedonobacteraceae bacterium]|nr:Imm1 family immunity protein [Ktedonobacteraceae bacterium]